MKDDRNIPAAADLIQMIQFAFESVRLEDGISWHQADAIDEYRDGIAERAMDDCEHWKDMTYEDLDDGSSAPAFLDVKGLRFYLPAYMLSVLRGRPFRYNTAAHFLWRLSNQQTVEALLPLLSEKQIEAVSFFLVSVEHQPRSDHADALACWNANRP